MYCSAPATLETKSSCRITVMGKLPRLSDAPGTRCMNRVLKGRGFSYAATDPSNQGLYTGTRVDASRKHNFPVGPTRRERRPCTKPNRAQLLWFRSSPGGTSQCVPNIIHATSTRVMDAIEHWQYRIQSSGTPTIRRVQLLAAITLSPKDFEISLVKDLIFVLASLPRCAPSWSSSPVEPRWLLRVRQIPQRRRTWLKFPRQSQPPGFRPSCSPRPSPRRLPTKPQPKTRSPRYASFASARCEAPC